MKTHIKTDSHTRKKLIKNQLVTAIIGFTMLILGLFAVCNNTLHAQSTTQSSAQTTLSGTLHIYLVTNYGEGLQEIDHCRQPRKEGECITFVLKTDKPVDMTSYLSQEEIEFLSDNGTIWQSEFMIVPDWEKYKSFSEKDFAARFANKRIRVTGSLFCPMAGWQNATLVRMDFSKVEVAE